MATTQVLGKRRFAVAYWQNPERRSLLLLLGAAVLVRLLLAPYHGFFGDLQTYVQWGVSFDRDPLHFYANTVTAEYTPFTIYLYGLLDLPILLLAHLMGTPASFTLAHAPLLTSYMKLPDLVAEVALTGLLYGWVRRVADHRWALVAAAAFAFSPTILLVGMAYGQTDAIYAVCAVSALVLVTRGRAGWAGVWLATAVMVKPTPVFLAVLPVVYLWRWQGWRAVGRFGLAGGLVALLGWLPFLLPPQPQVLAWLHNVSVNNLPLASYSAYNLWWALFIPYHPSNTPVLGPLSPEFIGLSLFAAMYLLAGYAVWRDRSPAVFVLAAALLALGFFAFTVQQHERFLYLALPSLLLATGFTVLRRSAVWLYVVTSAFLFANTVLVLITHDRTSNTGLPVSGLAVYFLAHPQPLRLLGVVCVGIVTATAIVLIRHAHGRAARGASSKASSRTGNGDPLTPGLAPCAEKSDT